MDKFQLHISGLVAFGKCGIAFYRRSVLGEKERKNVSSVVGLAVDKIVSADLTEKMNTGKLLPFDVIGDMARDSLVAQWGEDEVTVNAEDAEAGWRGTKGDAIDASVALSELYHDQAAPFINPTHVQRSWTLEIEGLDIQLAGTIDVQEGLRRISDTKTRAKSPNKGEADESIQLTTYALAVRTLDGAIPEEVGLDVLVRTPKRMENKLVQLTSIRTDAHMPPLIARIEKAQEVMRSGMFTPADSGAWWCSSRWCSFWDTCPYAMRPVSVRMAA